MLLHFNKSCQIMKTQTIDLERIKSGISVADLIGQSYPLVPDGSGRLRASDHDSLKVWPAKNNWTWYSQGGKGGKALGGSVIDWYMFAHSCDVAAAIKSLSEMLNGGAVAPVPPLRVEAPVAKVEEWKSPDWQRKAAARLQMAVDTLHNSPSGAPGREYLQSRGISLDMALAYDLGYGMAWNGQAQAQLPALWIPWQRDKITAIQYRFIGVGKDDDSASRFGAMVGSTRYLFGLQHCVNPADYADDTDDTDDADNTDDTKTCKLQTLIIVEGELNAVSLMQVVYRQYACDVVSYGPQSNINKDAVAKMAATVASRYQYAVVWADEPLIALKAIGNIPGALPMKSPGGLDANDLLMAGALDGFVFELLKKVKK